MAKTNEIKPIYVEGTHFIKSKWGGSVHEDSDKDPVIDNYECVDCQFKTTEPARMNDHLRLRDHRWPWPKEDKSSGLKLNGKHPNLAIAKREAEQDAPKPTPAAPVPAPKPAGGNK
jgi:hypothetical protein